MKTFIKLFTLSIVLNTVLCIAPQKAYAQVSVSFQVFYDELSPYGTWIDNSDYGYVWMPNVAPGFTPYATNGYWIFTDEGWTWVSNYSWGWAPFHYGRWYTDAIYGPMWVPDNQWGPGWVTWRRSEGYYGWAPIAPGISIDIAYGDAYVVPNSQWTFVRGGDFGRRDINNFYVKSSNNVTIINNTTVINNVREDKARNVRYNGGPDRIEVEKRAGKTFTPIAIKESAKPGQSMNKNELELYRPRMEKNNSNGQKTAPSKVTSLKDVKPATQRNVEIQSPKREQPVKQQPTQQQKNVPINKDRTTNPQHRDQPLRQPSEQQQAKPVRRSEGTTQPQQSKPPRNTEGENQQQRNPPQPKREQVQPQQSNPPKNREIINQPRQNRAPRNTGGEGQQPRQVKPQEQAPSQPQRNNEQPHQQQQQQQQPQQQKINPNQNQNTGRERHPH